jgi:hypothetical protein
MKHILLSLAFLFCLTLVSAQPGLQILDHSNNDVTGKTVTVYNNDHNAGLLEIHLKVKNTGNSDLNVFMVRVNNLVAGSSTNSFCFGVNCYPPFVDTSQVVTSIPAGHVDTSFTGDYYPTGAIGVSSVTYIFYDNDAAVSASVTVNFAVAPIELFDAAGSLLNGTVYPVLGTDTSMSATISASIKVLNNSGADIELFVHRISNSLVPNTSNSFCYGVCYPPYVDTSFVSVMIPNGTTDSTFIADYFPMGQGGTTSLTYEFFDNGAFGCPLVASFTVEFTLRGVGISEIPGLAFSGPSPNPASGFATFSYSLPANMSGAYLSIRNILGVEVQNILLDKTSGKAIVNTSQLQPGMYVCSLISNGKAAFSKKLIVKH